MFTVKHHAGFCMWDTATTSFGVMHTPYGKDVLRAVVDAFRKRGIAIGITSHPTISIGCMSTASPSIGT